MLNTSKIEKAQLSVEEKILPSLAVGLSHRFRSFMRSLQSPFECLLDIQVKAVIATVWDVNPHFSPEKLTVFPL